jgi:hypothetical protein
MKAPPYKTFTIKSTLQGRTFQNVFEYKYVGGLATQASVDAEAIAWKNAVGPAFLNASCTAVEFLSVRCDIHDGTDLWSGFFSYAGTFGALMADPLPGQDACVLTRHIDSTGYGGRIVRGRVFFSGVDETQVNQGTIQGAYLALIEVIGTDALAYDGGSAHQIWSTKLSDWRDVLGYTAEPVVKTIRHRRVQQ